METERRQKGDKRTKQAIIKDVKSLIKPVKSETKPQKPQ